MHHSIWLSRVQCSLSRNTCRRYTRCEPPRRPSSGGLKVRSSMTGLSLVNLRARQRNLGRIRGPKACKNLLIGMGSYGKVMAVPRSSTGRMERHSKRVVPRARPRLKPTMRPRGRRRSRRKNRQIPRLPPKYPCRASSLPRTTRTGRVDELEGEIGVLNTTAGL